MMYIQMSELVWFYYARYSSLDINAFSRPFVPINCYFTVNCRKFEPNCTLLMSSHSLHCWHIVIWNWITGSCEFYRGTACFCRMTVTAQCVVGKFESEIGYLPTTHRNTKQGFVYWSVILLVTAKWVYCTGRFFNLKFVRSEKWKHRKVVTFGRDSRNFLCDDRLWLSVLYHFRFRNYAKIRIKRWDLRLSWRWWRFSSIWSLRRVVSYTGSATTRSIGDVSETAVHMRSTVPPTLFLGLLNGSHASSCSEPSVGGSQHFGRTLMTCSHLPE
jgi:hypothetical protein